MQIFVCFFAFALLIRNLGMMTRTAACSVGRSPWFSMQKLDFVPASRSILIELYFVTPKRTTEDKFCYASAGVQRKNIWAAKKNEGRDIKCG